MLAEQTREKVKNKKMNGTKNKTGKQVTHFLFSADNKKSKEKVTGKKTKRTKNQAKKQAKHDCFCS